MVDKHIDAKYKVSSEQVYKKINTDEFDSTDSMPLSSKLECLVGYGPVISSIFEALGSERSDDNIIIFSQYGSQAEDLVKVCCDEYISKTRTKNMDQVGRYNFVNPKNPIVFQMQAGRAKELKQDLKFYFRKIIDSIAGYQNFLNELGIQQIVVAKKIQELEGQGKKIPKDLVDMMEIKSPEPDKTEWSILKKEFNAEKQKKNHEIFKKTRLRLQKQGFGFLEKDNKLFGAKTYRLIKNGKDIYKKQDQILEEAFPKEYLDFQNWRYSFSLYDEEDNMELTIIRKICNHLRFLYSDENKALSMIDDYEQFLFENVGLFKNANEANNSLARQFLEEKLKEVSINILQDSSGSPNKIRFAEADAKNLIGLIGQVNPFAWGKKEHECIEPGKFIQLSGPFEGKRNIIVLKDMDSILTSPSLGKYLAEALEKDEIKPLPIKSDIDPEPMLARIRAIAVLNESPYSRHYFHHLLNGKLANVFKREITLPHTAENSVENRKSLVNYIRYMIEEKNYLHAAPEALAKIIEINMAKVSTEFLDLKLDEINDLYSRANFIAGQNGETIINAQHIEEAFEKKINEGKEFQMGIAGYNAKKYFPQKKEVGVIGGLAVILSKPMIGSAFRIAISAIPNKLKGLRFFDIEKESKLAGSSFIKSFEQIELLLKEKYQRSKLNYDIYLSLAEQYSHIDGPSASTAISVACISAISKIPIFPNVFFTGAIDPKDGKSLRIGGLNEKIMGVIDLARNKGLEDVVIGFPKDNLEHLQLIMKSYRDVIDSGRVGIYSYDNLDEALEIALRQNASSVHQKIINMKKRKGILQRLFKRR
ncbi:MAG: S16 family serine protease [Nanoarchaeota archaeon]|nr:S16 family serine protease [Nanoarchaeota archaeon]